MQTNPTTLDSLSAEASRLAALIRDSQSRLNEIETLIRLAKKFNLAGTGSPQPIAASLEAHTKQLAERIANPQTMKARILSACETVLADGSRRFSRQLVLELAKVGVVVGGADPAANLSSYLSKEKDLFTSNLQLGGWTLTRLTQKVALANVQTAAGAGNPSNSP